MATRRRRLIPFLLLDTRDNVYQEILIRGPRMMSLFSNEPLPLKQSKTDFLEKQLKCISMTFSKIDEL